MSNERNGRIPVDALDYLLDRQKKTDFADRRPALHKPSDLVGPGIGAAAVRISDYNNLLATFNGYYSSAPGAINAPNGTEAFVGTVVSDAQFGGRQTFTGLTSGIEYSRSFTRSPTDPETLGWGPWTGQRIPATARGDALVMTTVYGERVGTLAPPQITVVGDAVYERNESGGILLNRQGVYTGHVQVGVTLSATSGSVYFTKPDKTLGGVIVNAPTFDSTIHLPFTCAVTEAGQGFAVAVLNPATDARTYWWRFFCTRVGDAV